MLGFAAVAVAGVLAWTTHSSGSTATLVTGKGQFPIEIEIADTPSTRETGLMNRETLAEDSGMLFDFGEARPVDMWMKNTLIPLDMLFLDETGRIVRIGANAQPLSLDLISSGGPVRYVLEINGGAAARYGAAPGDRLEHSIIPRRN
ncbi:hypothetical protein M673_10735 [Aureimonas sp. AU20]|nr:hypothetical protein M673_10735 [Aureimonas sp. AU20]